MMARGRLLVGVLIAVARVAATDAHHSFTMYDQTQVVSIQGVVRDFQWTNPHAVLHVLVAQSGGDPRLWTIEMTSPGVLTREGWTRTMLRPDDRIEVQLHPLRDGRLGGGFVQLTLANGQTLK
jgi:hypothetical protein